MTMTAQQAQARRDAFARLVPITDDTRRAAGCRWVCSYRGEAEYHWQGRKFAVRTSAYDDGYYNGDYFETGIRPFVGTIRCDDCGRRFEFPPAEVCALFPDHEPARYLPEFVGVEYLSGKQPETVIDKAGHVVAVFWARLLVAVHGFRLDYFPGLKAITEGGSK